MQNRTHYTLTEVSQLLQTKRRLLIFMEQNLPELQTCALKPSAERYDVCQFQLVRTLLRQVYLQRKTLTQVIDGYLHQQHGYRLTHTQHSGGNADRPDSGHRRAKSTPEQKALFTQPNAPRDYTTSNATSKKESSLAQKVDNITSVHEATLLEKLAKLQNLVEDRRIARNLPGGVTVYSLFQPLQKHIGA